MKRLNFLGTLLLTAALSPLALAQVKIVNGPNVEQATDNTAVIAWSTDSRSNSAIVYGTDKDNLSNVERGPWGGTANNGATTHRITLKNLSPNTTYYYQVQSGEAEGTATHVKSEVKSFRTGAQGATSADAVRIVDGPNVEQFSDTSAVIAWSTNVPSNSAIAYGTQANQLTQVERGPWGGTSNNGVTTHRITLKNLRPATTYFFEAQSGEAKGSGTRISADVKSFTTAAAGQSNSASAAVSGQVNDHVKIQAGPVAQNVTDKSATIWWMTTDNTRSVIRYGKDKNNLDQTARAEAGTAHKIALSNLEPGTTYHFVIMSHDNLKRGEGSFQTETAEVAADAKKLRIINGPVIEYVTPDRAIVAWSTNARASTTVRYGTDANNLNQTATAPWGQATHRVTINNLKPDTKYYFVVESSQAEGTGTMAKSNPAEFSTVAQGAQALRNTTAR